MVRMMVQRTTTLRHFLRKGNLQASHSMGATENSMNSTVRYVATHRPTSNRTEVVPGKKNM